MITGTNKQSPTGGMTVHIGGKLLDPGPSQAIVNHSPDGFAWGYCGSGPAQLALAILLQYTDERTAIRHYQKFKEDILAALPQSHFRLKEGRVHKWLKDNAGDDYPKVPGSRYAHADRPKR